MGLPFGLTISRAIVGAAIALASFWITLELLSHFAGISEQLRIVSIETGAHQDDLGWPGATMRVVIPALAITTDGTDIAVKFGAGPSKGLHVVNAYIGYAASTGNPYDFETAPTPLSFGGSRDVHIARGASTVSDMTTFAIQRGKNILIAYYIDDKQNDDPVAKPTTPGWHSFYKFGNDSGTLKASSYDDRTAKFVSHGVAELRIGVPN